MLIFEIPGMVTLFILEIIAENNEISGLPNAQVKLCELRRENVISFLKLNYVTNFQN